MANGAVAGGAAAAIANAIKASGVLVRVEPEEFQKILRKTRDPLVVCAEGGIFRTNYQYLFSFQGLAFFTKSRESIYLPGGTQTVLAKQIHIPG